MTTTVTVKTASHKAFIYTAQLDKDLNGEFELFQTVEPNQEVTTYIHDRLDLMVTENTLVE